MTRARRLVVVSAGLSEPSSTRMLAERMHSATVAQLEGDGIHVESTWTDLRDYAQDATAMLLTGFGSPELETAIAALTGADGAILVTPIFTTSYSGLFKMFIDLLEPDSLTDLPIALGATAGTPRHSLAIDYAMRPLFMYHHATVVSTGVFAATADWGGDPRQGLTSRVARAAGELAALMRDSTRSQQVADPFALPAGFDPSGARRAPDLQEETR